MKKSKKLQKPNHIHVVAATKTGAGHHGDKKKETAKKLCRKKVNDED